MKMTRPWLTDVAYIKLVGMEDEIHRYMTKLGWTECVGDFTIENRVWNFLDYLEQTYVIPTYQKHDPRTSIGYSSSSDGVRSTPQGVVEFWSGDR